MQQETMAEGAGKFLGWVTELVHSHRGRLVGLARSEGLDAEDAYDCVQDAFHNFLALPRARLLATEPEDAGKLLSVLVRNVARNQRRRHFRSRPHDSDPVTLEGLTEEGTVEEVVERAETYAAAVGCVATLGEIQRAVVTLRLVDEVPGEDVASMLGTTPGNVAVMLHRGKAALRACIQ